MAGVIIQSQRLPGYDKEPDKVMMKSTGSKEDAQRESKEKNKLMYTWWYRSYRATIQ